MKRTEKVNKLTEYLYSRPSFLEGMARLMDISDSLSSYNITLSPKESDALALWSDCLVVGDDLKEAIVRYHKLNQQALKPLTKKQKKLLTTVGK